MADVGKLPACFLADLIHAQMATGNFGKMAQDAIANARRRNDLGAVDLYNSMLGQIADYHSQSDDGSINIVFRPAK